MKTFAIGDIHGADKALVQCLERSNFNKKEDKLIILGDVVDGWPESMKVIKELLTVDNHIYIIGNHDKWYIDFMGTGEKPHIWTSQGGQATLDSFYSDTDTTLEEIELFFDQGVYYHIEDNKLFVHGGFNWMQPIQKQKPQDLMWDRDLWYASFKYNGNMYFGEGGLPYDEVYIGHTTTSRVDPELKPVNMGKIWNLDQGCGWEGKLTIMDINTKEYWQSDLVKTLYPDVKGR